MFDFISFSFSFSVHLKSGGRGSEVSRLEGVVVVGQRIVVFRQSTSRGVDANGWGNHSVYIYLDGENNDCSIPK